MVEFKKARLKLEIDKKTIYKGKITKPLDMVKAMNKIEKYNELAEEYVIVIALNNGNNIIAYSEVAKGSERFSNVDLSSIFKFVLTANASKFILIHNHPFGSVLPSKKDLEITKELKKASDIMRLQFIDHIIITGSKYTSILSILDN